MPVSPEPRRGVTPRALLTRLRADERRGWLSHGLAAMAISGLGLAVAGSMALTTSAETTQGGPSADARVVRAADAPSAPLVVPGTGAAAPAKPSAADAVTQQTALQPFAPQDAADGEATAERVKLAVVKERAAQRTESLSKKAEDATRQTRAAGSDARSKDLATTDREIRENAVKIATERRQRAIAARVKAAMERKRAEEQAKAAATTTTTPTRTDPAPSTPTTPPADTSDIPSGGNGASPTPGAVIGTPFGATGLWARYHTGLDFRAAQGTPIRAVQSGVVLYAGNTGNWSGNHVAIRHADGMTTMSSHMSSMAVRAGETVSAGQVIGRVGQTGRAFGAHLHFELYPKGVKYGDIYSAINPVPWLRANGVKTR